MPTTFINDPISGKQFKAGDYEIIVSIDKGALNIIFKDHFKDLGVKMQFTVEETSRLKDVLNGHAVAINKKN